MIALTFMASIVTVLIINPVTKVLFFMRLVAIVTMLINAVSLHDYLLLVKVF